MDIELLRNSCTRLPKLIELDAPACIILSEFRILSAFAIEAIDDALWKQAARLRKRKLDTESKPTKEA